MRMPHGATLVGGALVVSLALIQPRTTSPSAALSDSTAYHQWYEALRDAAPDPTRGAAVQNLILKRDVATLELIDGYLHLLQPIDGRTVGAVFVGQGRFSLTPPISVERDQLKRFYDVDSLARDIKTAVLFFTDETAEELSSALTWETRPAPSNAAREVEEALKYLSDDDGWMHRDLMVPMLNGGPGFFHAHVAQSRGDPLIFTVNPYEFEEVSLSRRAKKTRGHVREVVTQFHQQADYKGGMSQPQEALDLVRVSHYDIESTFASNLDFSATATLTVQRVATDHAWIPFRLYYELEVDSIRWGDGTPAAFYRPKESIDLWIDFASAPSDSTQLTFFYGGDLCDQYQDLWVEVKSTTTWYPVYEYGRLATHRLTFHAPEKLTVVSVGSQLSETTDDKVVTTVWETPLVRWITFNIGEFEDHIVEEPGLPRLRVQVNERAHNSLGRMARDANVFLWEQRNMEEQVAFDIARSIAVFNDAFGPTPVNEFVATEIPYEHGEAYPGLILLSWRTFQWTSDKGFDEMFRAHEVAHQWWGIGVHPATYHDRWLSEGFSEFAGLWYMGRIRGSIELFMRRLKETREAILKRRDEAGPIWLGTRVGTSEHPEDYQTIVYQKGAWVLHMLRNLVNSLSTDEDIFENLMNDFYMAHLGQTATTEQFQQVVEHHAGISMDWFFHQWVYGSAIPTYRFSYKLEELEGGKYKATVRVRQENVPDDFQMPVPIRIDFGAHHRSAQVWINVRGPFTEQELPVLFMKPDRIELNPLESVLAETKTEGWRN